MAKISSLDEARRILILSGAGMSTAAGIEAFEIFAEIAGTELLVIDEETTRRNFAQQIRVNQSYYRLAQGF